MAPIGYADGLLKPANQVRAQKALVKQVPGSNLPKQPAKPKVKQSARELLEAQQVKQQQQAYLPPSGSLGPIREVQSMKGLSGINRDVDFDATFKTREQIGKIVSQADQLRRGRTVSEVMLEAENLGHTIRHNPQLAQDLRRDQIMKRRHAMVDLVRTNRHPEQKVEDLVKIPKRRRPRPTRAPPVPTRAPHFDIATPRGPAASRRARHERGPIAAGSSDSSSVGGRERRRLLPRRSTPTGP